MLWLDVLPHYALGFLWILSTTELHIAQRYPLTSHAVINTCLLYYPLYCLCSLLLNVGRRDPTRLHSKHSSWYELSQPHSRAESSAECALRLPRYLRIVLNWSVLLPFLLLFNIPGHSWFAELPLFLTVWVSIPYTRGLGRLVGWAGQLLAASPSALRAVARWRLTVVLGRYMPAYGDVWQALNSAPLSDRHTHRVRRDNHNSPPAPASWWSKVTQTVVGLSSLWGRKLPSDPVVSADQALRTFRYGRLRGAIGPRKRSVVATWLLVAAAAAVCAVLPIVLRLFLPSIVSSAAVWMLYSTVLLLPALISLHFLVTLAVYWHLTVPFMDVRATHRSPNKSAVARFFRKQTGLTRVEGAGALSTPPPVPFAFAGMLFLVLQMWVAVVCVCLVCGDAQNNVLWLGWIWRVVHPVGWLFGTFSPFLVHVLCVGAGFWVWGTVFTHSQAVYYPCSSPLNVHSHLCWTTCAESSCVMCSALWQRHAAMVVGHWLFRRIPGSGGSGDGSDDRNGLKSPPAQKVDISALSTGAHRKVALLSEFGEAKR